MYFISLFFKAVHFLDSSITSMDMSVILDFIVSIIIIFRSAYILQFYALGNIYFMQKPYIASRPQN
ncbi:MAG: hypothetical protein QG610_168 [Euryarchaeota archaeon]|nr:hypothetical protein [Euryarchaeota archaeon]